MKIAGVLADMKFVINGTEIVYGIPGREVYEEVYLSNMSKTPAEGKAVKGPEYSPPDIQAVFDQQRQEQREEREAG